MILRGKARLAKAMGMFDDESKERRRNKFGRVKLGLFSYRSWDEERRSSNINVSCTFFDVETGNGEDSHCIIEEPWHFIQSLNLMSHLRITGDSYVTDGKGGG